MYKQMVFAFRVFKDMGPLYNLALGETGGKLCEKYDIKKKKSVKKKAHTYFMTGRLETVYKIIYGT